MLTPKDLASMKAFYENEYMVTVSKLKHIKKMLKKFEINAEFAAPAAVKSVTGTSVAPRKRGPKPGSKRKKAVQDTKVKVKISRKKAAKSRPVVKSKSKRSYNKWSEEIVDFLKKEQKPLNIKSIVDGCLNKKGITGDVELAKAAHSIRNLTYRLRNEKKLQEMKVKGSKGVLFGLSGWFKNGLLQDKYKQKK